MPQTKVVDGANAIPMSEESEGEMNRYIRVFLY
jgi:hypothetical protein